MVARVANRYKVEGFKILSVTIHGESNSKLLKTLKPGRYPFYDQGISEDFFAHNVNVSAIVGRMVQESLLCWISCSVWLIILALVWWEIR